MHSSSPPSFRPHLPRPAISAIPFWPSRTSLSVPNAENMRSGENASLDANWQGAGASRGIYVFERTLRQPDRHKDRHSYGCTDTRSYTDEQWADARIDRRAHTHTERWTDRRTQQNRSNRSIGKYMYFQIFDMETEFVYRRR